jgi:hypothetical protein
VRLLYVADGRSRIARSWIAYFIQAGHTVHLASTFPCEPLSGLASLEVVPVAFSERAGPGVGRGGASGMGRRLALRHWIGPFTVPAAAKGLRRVVETTRPDLVHGMRLPFEGMVAAWSAGRVPLILSTWGNDFTLHAPASPGMALLTRWALRRADALHTDCQRDARLARRWGFPGDRPLAVLPGNGGVRASVFHGGPPEWARLQGEAAGALRSIPPQAPLVVNPRGFRAYVRSDTFFRAIPRILDRVPEAVFLCVAMSGEAAAEGWVRRLGIERAVRLLPTLAPDEMAEVFRRAQVTVSVSQHDGTPNTLLEAMACGCFPVAGDLESIREWISQGENGLLVDPADPRVVAEAVVQSLRDPELRSRAAGRNAEVIAARARYDRVMPEAETFYQRVLFGSRPT